MEKQLTVEQALAEGYTDFVYNDDGFQSLKSIEDYLKDGSIDFSREDIRLVEKEPYHPSGLDSDEIAELLADVIYSNHGDDTGDDTDRVYDAIKAMDFSDVAERIGNELAKMNYYSASDIRLVSANSPTDRPNEQ